MLSTDIPWIGVPWTCFIEMPGEAAAVPLLPVQIAGTPTADSVSLVSMAVDLLSLDASVGRGDPRILVQLSQ